MTKKQTPDKRLKGILDAAIQEFLDKGYEGASIDGIAARAGLTKGGVYHHFGSKDELLMAANERFMEPVTAMMGRAMGASSPTAGLRAYCREYISYWSVHPKELAFVFLSLTKAMQSAALWPLYNGYRATMVGFFEEMARRASASGEMAIANPNAWSFVLFSALDGALAYVAMDESLGAKKTALHFTRLFIDALRVGRPDVAGGSTLAR